MGIALSSNGRSVLPIEFIGSSAGIAEDKAFWSNVTAATHRHPIHREEPDAEVFSLCDAGELIRAFDSEPGDQLLESDVHPATNFQLLRALLSAGNAEPFSYANYKDRAYFTVLTAKDVDYTVWLSLLKCRRPKMRV